MRWPLQAPQGELVITFDEASVSISPEGAVEDNWHLVFACDAKADLPFLAINEKEAVCSYMGVSYSVSATRGEFSAGPNSRWRILPEGNRVVLDFSARSSQ